VAGLLTITPAVWLAGLPVFGWLRRLKFWLREEPYVRLSRPDNEIILWILLVGGSTLLFLPLLVFISTSLRYLVDVLPVITLLTALSLWWALDLFRDRPFLRRMIILIAVILMLICVLIGTLSGFTLGTTPFEARNPALYDLINRFFQ
jgi:ABC-type spermidine/putrescine transport system permease subunit II